MKGHISLARVEELRARGKVQTEEECGAEAKAQRQAQRQHHMEEARSKVPAAYKHCTFENWEGAAPERLVHWLPNEHAVALIYGPEVGTGKTHLATAAWLDAAWIRGGQRYPGPRPEWWSAQRLLRELYAGFQDNSTSAIEFRVVNTPLLLLDDLGRQHQGSEDARARLVDVICERFDERRASIYTTNKTRAELEKWDAAAADRLYANTSLLIGRQGKSWRRR